MGKKSKRNRSKKKNQAKENQPNASSGRTGTGGGTSGVRSREDFIAALQQKVEDSGGVLLGSGQQASIALDGSRRVTVTDSDLQDGINWMRYDEWLDVDWIDPYEDEDDNDGKNDEKPLALEEQVAKLSTTTGDAEIAANESKFPKGSPEALDAALEVAWNDHLVSSPYGVGLAMGPKNEWLEWARRLSQKPDRLVQFSEEQNKDVQMQKSTLDMLANETEEGYCGSMNYIRALNCIFRDTFCRLSLDWPPCLHFQQGVSIRQECEEPIYKSRMRTWRAYQMRASEIMKVVREHPLDPKPDFGEQPDIEPVVNRGPFPTSSRRSRVYEEDYYDDGDDGCYGFSGGDVEDLLAQGVKPWDDDAGAVLAALNDDYY